MRKKRFVFGIVILIVLAAVVLIGFGLHGKKGGTRVVFTKGFAKDEIFRIENESCSLSEIMVYLTTTQNQYEDVYGEEIWKVSLDGVTLEQNVKETVLARIAQVKTMYLLAQDRGITLDAQETAAVKAAVKEYYQSLSDTEIKAMNLTESTVEKLYTEYALSQKVYRSLIDGINPEISDDEARIVTVQHILLRTYTTDGAGKRLAVSEETKKAAYEKICEIRELAVSGEHDFAELASKYSEDDTLTYSFGKGQMDQTFETAAFQLETDEISPVVETESGYHIIKCISTFNREETDANKLKIVEERRRETFAQEYDAFVETLARNLNQTLWDKVEFIQDDAVRTNRFFDVYEKYFPDLEKF
ncbi:MAG: peptidylprolyl isomerase [Lachnospiraceae bacterium]|nr:peptidylprolyl isomerase [Lachnospiraceae bacterium]